MSAAPHPTYLSARYHGGAQTPRAIVIHGTVSHDDAGTARQIASWWHGSTSPKTSAHYVVDPSEVVQCVFDHVVAYHCGHNQDSIGVELCDEQVGPASRWADKDSTAILDRASSLVARLCVAYNIDPHRASVADLKEHGPHGIYGHNDSRLAFGETTHTDPGDSFPWRSFLAAVQSKVAALKVVRKTTRPLEVVATLNLPTSSTPHIETDVEKAKAGLATFLEREKPDIVLLQEFGAKPEHPGYAFTKAHPVIGWRTDRYHKAGESTTRLAAARDVEPEKGRRAHLPAVDSVEVDLVELDTGDDVTASNGHLPAHVEIHGLYRKIKDQLTGRAAMHREARRKWRRELARQAKMSDRVYGGGDTNYDEPMRLRGFVSCWTGHTVMHTFGSRTIDRIYALGRAHTARAVKIPSDHRGVVATYVLRPSR